MTFQAVIISDGEYTFSMYMYLNGGMLLDATNNRKVEVGYGSTNLDTLENYYVFDTVTGNTGQLEYSGITIELR